MLSKIKKEIILNCSKIREIRNEKQVNYTYFCPEEKDDHIMYIDKNIIQDGYRDAGYGDDDRPEISLVSYNYYYYPNIVDQISKVLDGKYGGKLGFNIHFNSPKTKDNNTAEYISNQIILTMQKRNLSVSKKSSILHELISDLNDASQMKNSLKNVEDYFQDVFDCFNINYIEYFSLSELQTYIDFTGGNAFKDKIIPIEKIDTTLQSFIFKKIDSKNYVKKLTI